MKAPEAFVISTRRHYFANGRPNAPVINAGNRWRRRADAALARAAARAAAKGRVSTCT